MSSDQCQFRYSVGTSQFVTNAGARLSKSLRPRKPEGSLGRTAQVVHLDSHTAPELCVTEVKMINDDDELMLNVLRCHLTY